MEHAKIGELLDAKDEVARWILVLSLARNDLALTKASLEESFVSGDRSALHWSRLLAGHLFEITMFLRRSGDRPSIRQFAAALPGPTQADYRSLLAPDFLKRVLRTDRNLVFHYPAVDPGDARNGGVALSMALDEVKELPMYFRPTWDEESGQLTELRFEFADQVAVQFAATNFGVTDAEHREAAAQIKGYSEQLIALADAAVLTFLEQRGFAIGDLADPVGPG